MIEQLIVFIVSYFMFRCNTNIFYFISKIAIFRYWTTYGGSP